MSETNEPADSPAVTKASPRELFFAFLVVTMGSFANPVTPAHRVLVEKKKWLTEREFRESMGLGGFLPGVPMCNFGTLVGYRFAGMLGALAALAGLVVLPFLLMIGLGVLYQTYGAMPTARHAFASMTAAAAGILLASGVKMAVAMPRHWRPWLFCTAALFLVIGVGWRQSTVLMILAPLGIAASQIDSTKGGA
jgi:chromate transporter